jgi:hypothetical protein
MNGRGCVPGEKLDPRYTRDVRPGSLTRSDFQRPKRDQNSLSGCFSPCTVRATPPKPEPKANTVTPQATSKTFPMFFRS